MAAEQEPVDLTQSLKKKHGPVFCYGAVFFFTKFFSKKITDIDRVACLQGALLIILITLFGNALAADTVCHRQASLVTLTPGVHTLAFSGNQKYCYLLPADQAVVLEITDHDMDSKAAVRDMEGNVIATGRSWGWREGQYLLFAASAAQEQLWFEVQRINANNAVAEIEIKLQTLSTTNLSEPLPQLYQSISQAFTLRELNEPKHSSSDTRVFSAFLDAADRAEKLDCPYYQAIMWYELGLLLREISESEAALRPEASARLLASVPVFKSLGLHSEAADALNAAGRIESDNEMWDRAISLFEKAMDLRDPVTEIQYRAAIHTNIGLAQRAKGKLGLAMEHFTAALDVYICHWPEPDLSEAFFAHIESCGYNVSVAKSLNNLALVLEAYGVYKRAGIYWQIALQVALQADNVQEVAKMQQNLGTFYLNQERYNEAYRFLNTAVDYFKDRPESKWLAVNLGNLGRLYAKLGDDDAAIKYYRRALAVDHVPSRNRALLLRSMSLSLLELNDPAGALAATSEALKLLQDSKDETLIAVVYIAHAEVLEKLGRVGEAFSTLESARDLARRNKAEPLEGSALSQLASLRMNQIRRPAQTSVKQQSMEEWHQGRITALTEARNILLQSQQLSVTSTSQLINLQLLSEIAFELHKLDASDNSNGLQLALDYANQATHLAESRRLNAPAPQHRARYFANQRSSFDWYINLLMQAGRPNQACQVSERTRARSLLDLLEERRLSTPKEEAARQKRLELAQQINHLEAFIDGQYFETSSEEILSLDWYLQNLDRVSSEYALLEAEHSATNPPAVSIQELQQSLHPGQVVLSYFLGEKNSFLWTVTQQQINSFILPPRDELEALAEALIKRLRDSGTYASDIQRLADALGKTLFPAELQLVPNSSLIIMSDGLLHQVPFGQLWRQGDRLAENYSIQNVNSLAVWDLLQKRPLGRGQGVAVIANPTFGEIVESRELSEWDLFQRIELTDLGSSLLEGRQIISYVKDEPSHFLSGSEANRSALVDGQLEAYRILHFATHGRVDAKFPDRSGLLIAPVAGQAGPDFLRSNEISNMNLQADLVVLSSCETGVGQFHDGEGLLSLIQPFFIAGSRQVLASLWKVNDAATAQLMQRFYHHYLVEKLPAGKALSLAQGWLSSHPQWSHPNYWAGFALYGVDVE